jgi:hypothetical protein
MNSKLRPIVAGELDTPAIKDIINELVGISQRIGHIKVANKTGGTLVAGTLVSFDGYDTTLAAVTVVKADARPSRLCDVVLSESILTDHVGIAYTAGVVGGLVADVAVGTKVYLSATAGEFAFAAPNTAGDAVQVVGVVTVRHATAGSILFFPGAAAPGSIEDAYVLPATGIPATDLEDGAGLLQMEKAASAAVALKVVADPATDGTSAAVANAAAVGALKKTIHLALKDNADVVQVWYSGPVTLTPTETAVDEQIGVPTITGGNTVHLVAGEADVEVVYDTDAGATKVYAADDLIGFTTAIGAIFGVAPTVGAPADFVDTFVA